MRRAEVRLGRCPHAWSSSFLARVREKPVAQIARDLGISDSCLRNWIAQADVDDGHKPGLTSDERAELVALRRKNRVLAP